MNFKEIALASIWVLIMCILLACLWILVMAIASRYAPETITHPLPSPSAYLGG